MNSLGFVGGLAVQWAVLVITATFSAVVLACQIYFCKEFCEGKLIRALGTQHRYHGTRSALPPWADTRAMTDIRIIVVDVLINVGKAAKCVVDEKIGVKQEEAA